MHTRILYLLEILILFASCVRIEKPESHYTLFGVDTGDVSLDMKIGQMIMVGFVCRDTNSSTFRDITAYIDAGLIGGVLFYGYNIPNRSGIQTLTSALIEQSTLAPLLLATDEEGGAIQRLNRNNGFRDYPSPRKVGERYSLKRAYRVYKRMANDLKNAGFNLNFAPVVDVNKIDEGGSFSSYLRSFSSDAAEVASFAGQMIAAHHESGILTALKHYPGLGSTTNDTHIGEADISGSWGDEEMLPYRVLITNDLVDLIMVAHVIDTNIDPVYPASLSPAHIETNLRTGLGYDGAVITDDLLMGAVQLNYSLEETIRQAVIAGNDILLFSDYFYTVTNRVPELALETIRTAVENGTITEERIDRSYERIMRLKRRLKD